MALVSEMNGISQGGRGGAPLGLDGAMWKVCPGGKDLVGTVRGLAGPPVEVRKTAVDGTPLEAWHALAPGEEVSVKGSDPFHYWVRSDARGAPLVSWGPPEVLELIASYNGHRGSTTSWG